MPIVPPGSLAATQARGTYLCLLNNDTEIIAGDRLRDVMHYATRSEVARSVRSTVS